MEIVIENYSKKIRKQDVLKEINYSFTSGKLYGVFGKNGSGKTMLLRALAGLIFPTQGRILYDGRELRKDMDFPENIGIMIEYPDFIPQYTGFMNLKLLASIRNKIGDEEIYNTLDRVGLTPDDRRKVRKYSLGMKQRLGIAAAVMENPEILLLDEPFNALDETGIQLLHGLLEEYRDSGKLIIVASHDKEEVYRLADQVLYLEAGRIV